MHELMSIPLNKVLDNPVALRAVDRESEAYLGLVESIRAKGILNPISVRRKGNDFEIIDGLHRTTAARDAGLVEIPAQVLELDNANVLEAQIITNIHKIETTPVQYTKQLVRILASNPTMTEAELATKLGKSPKWISDRLGLLNLTEDIQSLVNEGKINLTNAYQLSRLPKEEQAAYIEQAMTKPPQEFVPIAAARVKEIKDARRQGRNPNAVAEFVATPHLRKISDLQNEIASGDNAREISNNLKLKTPEQGFLMGLQWSLHLDPASLESRKATWEAERKARAEAREKAKQERESKKAQEAAAAAVSLDKALGVA